MEKKTKQKTDVCIFGTCRKNKQYLQLNCIKVPPVRVVEMWVIGRDSSMLLDMGTCTGTLQGSGGSSRGGCRSAGLSGSSVLLGRFGDKD